MRVAARRGADTANLGVVLDTNVHLSGIAFPTSIPGRIVEAWRHGLVDVVLSPYILAELRRVLPRLSHRHGLSDVDLPALSADWPIATPVAFWAAHGGPTP